MHSDADKVDAVIENVKLQGNTVGQSAADSQGMPFYISRCIIHAVHVHH